MYIDLGDYVVTSDEFNIILNSKHVTKEGKKVGTEYLKPRGYFADLHSLVVKLLMLEINKSVATTLSDLEFLVNQKALEICTEVRKLNTK